MADPFFRLVATVPGTRLGNVLAGLQLAGCVIDACNVIVPEAPPKPGGLKRVKSKRYAQAMQSGVSKRTRDLLGIPPQGAIIKSTDIVAQLIAEGFKPSSASSVVATGLKYSRRFQVIEPGTYEVVRADQPIVLYKTAAMIRAEKEARNV